MDLFDTQATMAGARSSKELPRNHRSVQNMVFMLLPTYLVTEIA